MRIRVSFQNYLVFLSILCVIPFVGCGYQMVGKETQHPSGLNSIAIPTFKNETFEPGIEIPLTQAFLREFIQDRRLRVVDRMQADTILEGTIKSFSITSVSYDRSGYVKEYQANLLLNLLFRKQTGEVLWEEKNLSETRWFRASSEVLTHEANKHVAIQQIGRLMAERIRNRFFYHF